MSAGKSSNFARSFPTEPPQTRARAEGRTHARTDGETSVEFALRRGRACDTLLFFFLSLSQLLRWRIRANPAVTRRRICHGEGISLSYAWRR